MTVELGSAHGKIILDGSGVQDTVGQATRALGRLTLAGIGIAATVKIIQSGINAVKQYGSAVIGMGSDAQETASLIRNSLGPAADDFAANIDRIAEATNRSRFEMAQGVSSTIAMTKAMGFGEQQAADYAANVAQAGADLSSFFNVADAQVILDINSALAGSSEPMQKYGIDVRETALQNIALTHGLIQQGDAMDRATRATAVMIAIQEQASDAMGDAARTSDSFANQLRGVRAMVVDAATEIGSKMTPLATEIVSSFRRVLPNLLQIGAGIAAILRNLVQIGVNFIKALARGMGVNFDALASNSGSWGENIIVSLAAGMAAAASAVVSVLNQIGQIISYWLKPGSPPKLLPKLDEWGAGAMTAYMDGWGDGDFSIFDEIANTVEGFLRSLGDQVPEADLIPRVMGARTAVAEAVSQMRQFGSVSQSALDGIFNSAGITDGAIRNYVTTLFQLQAANEAVIAAQAEVNKVTKQYDDLLSPLNAQLDALNNKQESADAEQELAGIRKRLAEERLTDSEREQLMMQAQRIELEQQIRATEAEKAAAVAAANDKLDAAQDVQDQLEDQAGSQQSLIDVQEENNQMIADQLELLESLKDELADVGKTAASSLGKAFSELPDMIEPALASVGDAGDLFASKFDSVFERVSEQFEPLTSEVEELGNTWGGIFDTISTKINTFFLDVKAALQPLGEFLRPIADFLLENKETIFNVILGVVTALGGFAIISTVVGWIGGLIAIISTVAGFISYWYTVITGIAAAFGGWTVITGIVEFVVAALGGPLVVAIGAVAAAIGLLVVAWRENWGGIQEKTAAVWAFIQPFLQSAWDWLAVNVPLALQTLRTWWVDTVWPAIQLAIQTVWPIIEGIFTSISTWITDTLVPTLTNLYTKWVEEVWPQIQTATENVWLIIEEIFSEIGRWINDNIIPWVEYFQEVWADTVWPAIKEAVRLVWDFLEPIFEDIEEWAKETIPPALETMRGVFESVMSAIETAVQPVKDLWDKLVSAIQGFWEWISSHTFEFKISLPDLPDWAVPHSPIPLHTAWKNFANDMSRMRIAPNVDLSKAQDLLLGAGGGDSNSSVDQSSHSFVANFYGRGDRVADAQDLNTMRAIYGGT